MTERRYRTSVEKSVTTAQWRGTTPRHVLTPVGPSWVGHGHGRASDPSDAR